MSVDVDAAAFVVGSAASLSASGLVISRLVRLGERFGLTEALLGLAAALAADAPEITVAVTASSHRQGSIGVGVVLGSNLFNLAVLLGLGSVVAGLVRFHRRSVLFEGGLALGIGLVGVAVVFGWLAPVYGLTLAGVALLSAAAVLAMPPEVLRRSRVARRPLAWLASAMDDVEQELKLVVRPTPGTPLDAVVGLFALAVVVVASTVMERTGSDLAGHWKISSLIVGATVLAAVTSIPNAVAAVHLARRGRGAALLSEALNSNSINLVAGLLIPAAVFGIGSVTNHEALVAWWFLAATGACLVVAYLGHGLRRSVGWAILVGYAVFVGLLVAVAG